ncbi:MAG TPA: universal stress protein [Candidatus Avacidaminococcus intestinavium]|uniref:Universal stress protein n=1 Tax=Candidatus Avacidaminococcus intestinavium TaxID=2840684 RepID=A0A9D1MQE3_9FIRM|nr:universal stress protein [Candidatus Avacidaminococcus intestinavium]
MFKKILVPVDGSETAWRALEYAAALGNKFESKLLVVNVVQNYNNISVLAVPLDAATVIESNNELRRIGEHVLKTATSKLTDFQGKIAYKLEEGHPSETILNIANETECDCIVIGSRGLSGIKEFFLGSVSSKVSQYAKIPVLIVK